MLMCYKKQGQSEQFVRIFIKFATTRYDNYNSREDMLMYTKDEFKNENMKVNTKLTESSTPKQFPSIWYS